MKAESALLSPKVKDQAVDQVKEEDKESDYG